MLSPETVAFVSLLRGTSRCRALFRRAFDELEVAGALVGELAGIVGGKGGGRPDFAQAGGKDASKLDQVFARIEAILAGE